MDIDRTIMAGAGGVLIGAVLAYAIGASGRASLEAQLRQQGDVLATVTALEGRVGELQAGLGSLAGTLEGLGSTQASDRETLVERIEAVRGSVIETADGIGTEVAGSLQAQVQSLAARLEDLTGGGGARAAAAGAEPAAAAGPGAGETVGIGRTVALDDGGLRVFLSATDPAAGSARVAVDGVETSTLALGQPLASGDCSLTLTGFVPGGATVEARCGGTAADAVAAPPEGAGTAIAIGQTASLADGALRVFLSAKDEAAGRARVAINGVTPTEVALGEPMAAGDCAVTLTGFAPGGAMLAGTCGGSDAAETVAGSGAGTEIAVGSAASFADGAVRVFVSAVDAASGTARVAINGTTTTALAMSDPVAAGDCTATLTGAAEGAATLDVAC